MLLRNVIVICTKKILMVLQRGQKYKPQITVGLVNYLR